MSFVGKIRALQFVLASAVVGIAATVLFAASQSYFLLDRVRASRLHADAIEEFSIRVNHFFEQVAEVLLMGASELAELERAREEVAEQLDLIDQAGIAEITLLAGRAELSDEVGERRRLTMIKDLFVRIDRAVERMRLLDQQGQRPQAIELFRTEIEDELDEALQPIIAEALDDEHAEVEATDRSARLVLQQLLVSSLALVLLLMVLTAGSSIFLSRMLRARVAELTHGALAIGQGDLGHRIPVISRDEFGVLAGRFNTMIATLQEKSTNLIATRDNLEKQVKERTKDLELANVQLSNLDEQRLRFLADVSHELRTPVTAIRTEAEVVLRSDTRPAEEYRAALASIAAQSAGMSDLVRDLMFIARAEAEELRFEFCPVSIKSVVCESVRDISIVARSRDLLISINGPEPGPMVRADPRHLKHALMAVLENATTYATPQSTIQVEFGDSDEKHAEICVRDTGKGIPADEVEHVFDRFFRGSNADMTSGSGLGLSITRWIVERHNGQVSLSSEAGRGTVVRLSIPLAA